MKVDWKQDFKILKLLCGFFLYIKIIYLVKFSNNSIVLILVF